MKLKESKSSKIALAVIGCLSGAIAVLFAIAFLLTIIMRVGFIQALKNKYTYLIWCSVVAIGVLVVMIDLRVRGSKRVLKVVHEEADGVQCPIATEPDEPLGRLIYDSREEAADIWNKRTPTS